MIAALRAAVVARLIAAEIVPSGCVLNGHLAAAPADKARTINVSTPGSSGKVGPGAGYAIDSTFIVLLECNAKGAGADAPVTDLVDAMVWLSLRALLIDPDFRGQWPLTAWKEGLEYVADAGKSDQTRQLQLTFELPVDFTTTPTALLLEVGAAYDTANIVPGADGEEDLIEDTIPMDPEE